MKNTNEEYIQLPPLPSDTEGFVVQMFWEFMKLSKEEKEKVHADLKSIVNKDNIEPYKAPEKYREIKREELAAFEETIKNMIRSLVLEASDVASWVYVKKYIEGWTLEQMIEDMPNAIQFIIAMDTLFDKNMDNLQNGEYKN